MDLTSLRLRAELEQTRASPDVAPAEIRFLPGTHLVVAEDSSAFTTHSIVALPVSGFIDTWDWPANEIRSLAGRVGLHSIDGSIPTRSKFVIDDERIVDLATGRLAVSSVPEREVRAGSRSVRWAVVREAPADLLIWISTVADQCSTALGRRLSPLPRQRLRDLDAGRSVASLDPDHFPKFSPDSRWLISSGDKTLDVWPLPVPLPWGRAALWSLGIWLIPLSARFLPRRRTTPA